MPEVMMEQRIVQTLSLHDCFCHGTLSPCSYYFLGINFAVAAVKRRFSHQGTSQLDAIHALVFMELHATS